MWLQVLGLTWAMSVLGTAVSRLVSLLPPVDMTSLTVGWGGHLQCSALEGYRVLTCWCWLGKGST